MFQRKQTKKNRYEKKQENMPSNFRGWGACVPDMGLINQTCQSSYFEHPQGAFLKKLYLISFCLQLEK